MCYYSNKDIFDILEGFKYKNSCINCIKKTNYAFTTENYYYNNIVKLLELNRENHKIIDFHQQLFQIDKEKYLDNIYLKNSGIIQTTENNNVL